MSVRLSVLFTVATLSLVACNSGNGNNIVLRMQAEVAGPRCPSGGVAVQIGFDANSNQVLDDSEVNADQTKYLCNGAPGAAGMVGPAGDPGDAGTAGPAGAAGLNALSQVTAEPAGANCRYGGSRVDVGMDTNADGTLGAGEITSTRYICDRASVDSVYFGDITIRTAADLALLDGIQTIAGTLTIESLPGGVLALPDLKVVSNRIVFTARDGGQGPVIDDVTSATFPELLRVGELNARFSDALVTLAAPKLERATRVDISYDSVLTGLSLPKLAYVDDVYIQSNSALTSLNLAGLKTARTLQVNAMSLLTSFTAPLLTEVDAYLSISNNPLLSVCDAYRVLKQLTGRVPSRNFGGDDETPTCSAADICATTPVTGISSPLSRCVRPLTFAEARTTCATISSNSALAWVTSDAEWIALSTAISTGAFPAQGWFGYTDSAVEGTWAPVTSATTYSPSGRTDFWAPGEPSDTSMSENALQLFNSGLANDASDTTELPFICR